MTLIARPLALAKLLSLGALRHVDAARICGWGDAVFAQVAREAHAAGLITWHHRLGERWYVPGLSLRRAAARRGAERVKKFACNDNKTLQKETQRLQ